MPQASLNERGWHDSRRLTAFGNVYIDKWRLWHSSIRHKVAL
jgi:hypothetical protein